MPFQVVTYGLVWALVYATHLCLICAGGVMGTRYGWRHGLATGTLIGLAWASLGGLGGLVAGHLLGVVVQVVVRLPGDIYLMIVDLPKARRQEECRQRYFARLAAEKAAQEQKQEPRPELA